MNPTHKAVLINLPVGLLKQLDRAAASLDLTRSELMRRSLRRDLSFVVRHEVAEVSRAKAKTAALYANWAHCIGDSI